MIAAGGTYKPAIVDHDRPTTNDPAPRSCDPDT